MGYQEDTEGEWVGGGARGRDEEHMEGEVMGLEARRRGEEPTEVEWGGGEARWRGEELLLAAGQEEELQEELSEGSSAHWVRLLTCNLFP